MATILITHGIPAEGFCALREHTLILPPPLCAFSEEELLLNAPAADAIVAGGKVSAAVIRAAKKLKIIANYGAGYDGVDVQAAREMGVPVTNIPDSVTQDTAELALGLMLAASRRIGEMNLRLRREEPENLFGMGKYMGQSLRGKTLGILGCGRIGSRTASLARAFGMEVMGYSRRGCDSAVARPVSLDTLLREADVLSLHCPLTTETRGLIDAEAFARMKDGAILINTARGAVVDTAALLAALDSGKVWAAGLDVFPDEPRIPPALLQHERVVCTPHIGTNTALTRREMAEACSRQILDALSGKRPQNIVNGL
ncbi:MAG: D-glycerate dehydrogenase [Clostridia bacterium]|nr:D-glycerate dehydrogenase [Clostridia bacterium]